MTYCVEWDVKLYYTIPYHTIPYHNVYDSRVAPSLSYNTSVTRGNKFKLQNQSVVIIILEKKFFSARTVNIWNNLPN